MSEKYRLAHSEQKGGNNIFLSDDEMELELGTWSKKDHGHLGSLQNAFVSTSSILSIVSLVALNFIDKRYLSSIMDGYDADDEVIYHLSQYSERPPTTIFISFLLLLLSSITPIDLNRGFIQITMCILVIWCQCSYLIMIISSVIKDLAIEKGFGWLLVVMCSITIHSFLFPLNGGHGKIAYLKSFHSWITILGCLFEICKYSTYNMTNFVLYYSGIGGRNYGRVVLVLSVVHVLTIVIVGLSLLATVISSSDDDSELLALSDDSELEEFEEVDCPNTLEELKEKVKPWEITMLIPFVVVSIYHCYQLQWAQVAMSSSS
mgnify:FL=1